jgi:hypothetical protein
LWAQGLNEEDIHKEIFLVNGGKCLWRKAVHNWVMKFSQEHSTVAYDAQSSPPVDIATETTV